VKLDSEAILKRGPPMTWRQILEFYDGHETHPIPETWLQAHPCPQAVDKGCKRCWIDYCTALAVEAIDEIMEEKEDGS